MKFWLVAGVASAAHAVWRAEAWDGASAARWQATLLYAGHGHEPYRSPLVAVDTPLFAAMGPVGPALALFPFHLLMAWGLWASGRFGWLALAFGLLNPAMALHAARGLPSFAWAAGISGMVGAIACRRWGMAVVSAIAMHTAYFSMEGDAAGMTKTLVRGTLEAVQPALGVAVVAALLFVGSRKVLGLLAGAVAVGVSACWLPAEASVAVVPILAVAASGLGGGLGALFALAAGAQLVGQHAGWRHWPAPSGALTPARSPDFDFAPVIDWIDAHGGGRVSVSIPMEGPLNPWQFARAAAARNVPFELVPVDGEYEGDAEIGLTATLSGRADPMSGWRALLPEPNAMWTWPPDYVVSVFDHGLPPLRRDEHSEAARRAYEPARHALYARLGDGAEVGPLLQPASSPEVVRDDVGWHVLFVRDQALWRAESVDGIAWGEAEPTGLAAFDPALLRVADGWRLFAVELVGDDPLVDPARHATRVVTWHTTDFRTFTREPGERLAGIGVVDPFPVGRELYFTMEGSRIVRATSDDGSTFVPDRKWSLARTMVPALTPDGEWLVAQRHVANTSVLYALRREGDTFAQPRSLDVCGTAPSLVEDRLYYTRDPAVPCEPPVVEPGRRGGLPWGRR